MTRRGRGRGGGHIVAHLFQSAKGRASHLIHEDGELRSVHDDLQWALCGASRIFIPERPEGRNFNSHTPRKAKEVAYVMVSQLGGLHVQMSGMMRS